MNLVPHDHPALSTAVPTADINATTLREFAETARAMHAIMVDKRNPGIGIAAPQVGLCVRMFVMNTRSSAWQDARVCINPKVLETRAPVVEADEGCLTRPGLRYRVARSEDISVAYFTLAGELVRMDFTGLNARVFQHELDHLNGRTQ